jgi:hypothetical protein
MASTVVEFQTGARAERFAVTTRTWETGGAVRHARRIAYGAVAAVALWLVALVVMNAALEARTRRRIADRIADSLQGEATIERGSLALVRGWIDLTGLSARKDELLGHLAIAVASTHCELPPLGLALIDRDCRDLVVRDAQLEVSSAALFRLRRPKRPPLRAERVVIEHARFELSPSALAPGLGRVAVAIEHAEAGPTIFKTPLSWLFALRELRATLDLPGGIALEVGYHDGTLRVAGAILGTAPVSLPLALPGADSADDPRTEIAKLVVVGKGIAERVIARKAEDWLRSLSKP